MKHTIRDTSWHCVQMGSEGWTVFAGPRMIASNLSKENARLIAAAPELLEALEDLFLLMDENQLVRNTSYDHLPDYTTKAVAFTMRLARAHQAIRKAKGE